MKRIIATCCVVAALVSSCGQTSNTYKIVGQVTNSELEGSKVSICQPSSDTVLDSATIVDGKFEMSGTTTDPVVLMIGVGRSTALLTTGKDVANVTVGDEIVVEQNAATTIINEVSGIKSKLYNEFSDFFAANQGDPSVDFYSLYLEMNNKVDSIRASYLTPKADEMVKAYIISEKVDNECSLEQIDSLIAIAPLAKNFLRVQTFRNSKVQAQKTAVGQPFSDFEGSTIEGEPSKLSDYVGNGNYVLVDFWASWCGPCRQEMPNLKAVYEKHKANGLILLGVNVWDKKEACIKAIEEESMTWPILYASDDRSATQTYGILGIPTIILFAPDGTIVDRTARGQQIMNLIDGVYAE